MNNKDLRCPHCDKKLGETTGHTTGSIFLKCNRCKNIIEFKGVE